MSAIRAVDPAVQMRHVSVMDNWRLFPMAMKLAVSGDGFIPLFCHGAQPVFFEQAGMDAQEVLLKMHGVLSVS